MKKIATFVVVIAIAFVFYWWGYADGNAGSNAFGFGTAAAQDSVPAEAAWERTELYMFAVPKPKWEQFLSEVVIQRFPDGMTVIEGLGHWKYDDGLGRLPTRILVILHPDTQEADASLEEIRSECKTRFGSKSVLRADSPVTASF